jgi:outer membrane lipopolysaccharide assembly protein LptE/RlpB
VFDRRGCGLASALLAATLGLTLAGTGCGYHVAGRGANLPKTWHTISVPIFANGTLHYRLDQVFTEAVIRELEARTTYHIVPDPKSADAELLGQMTSVEAVPVLYDSSSGRATTMLVTVHAKVRLEDLATKKIIYRNDNLVFRDEYELSTNPSTFFDEESPALDRMARSFASNVVSGILENF